MKVFLVRHGETDWNVQKRIQGGTDIKLNRNGIEQADQLGKKIGQMGIQINKIYSSKLERAYKTAETIGKHIPAAVEALEGLEEMNLGQWEGLQWREVKEQYPEEYKKWYHNRRYQQAPSGESYQQVLERVVKALHHIIKLQEQAVVVVTHSANIVTLLAIIHNIPFEEMFNQFRIGNASYVEIDSDIIQKIAI